MSTLAVDKQKKREKKRRGTILVFTIFGDFFHSIGRAIFLRCYLRLDKNIKYSQKKARKFVSTQPKPLRSLSLSVLSSILLLRRIRQAIELLRCETMGLYWYWYIRAEQNRLPKHLKYDFGQRFSLQVWFWVSQTPNNCQKCRVKIVYFGLSSYAQGGIYFRHLNSINFNITPSISHQFQLDYWISPFLMT